MTATEIQTKNYGRLDGYIDRISTKAQTIVELMKEYFNAAKEEGISEEEAKRYLKSRIAHSTYYKCLPSEITKRKYTVDNYHREESSTGFDTKGMGVVIPESESSSESATGSDGKEIEQEVEVPTTTTRPMYTVEEIKREEPIRREPIPAEPEEIVIQQQGKILVERTEYQGLLFDLQRYADLKIEYERLKAENSHIKTENEELKQALIQATKITIASEYSVTGHEAKVQ